MLRGRPWNPRLPTTPRCSGSGPTPIRSPRIPQLHRIQAGKCPRWCCWSQRPRAARRLGGLPFLDPRRGGTAAANEWTHRTSDSHSLRARPSRPRLGCRVGRRCPSCPFRRHGAVAAGAAYPEYGFKLACLQRLLAARPGKPLVLILGSSRVALGLRPRSACRALDDAGPVVFNFALCGAGPVAQLVCLRGLLARGIRPDRVFIECWPPFWDQSFSNPHVCSAIDVQALGWPDLRTVSHFTRHPEKLYRRWLQARLSPWALGRNVLATLDGGKLDGARSG